MKLLNTSTTALMLRLVIATIIAVALGLCSLAIDRAAHKTKRVGELIGAERSAGALHAPANVLVLTPSEGRRLQG
jgi:hypothetical protein